MIGIAVICLLLCGGILVFALNPDMTDALAQRLYGNGNNAETVTETAEAIGNPSNIGTDGSVSVTLPDQPENSLSDYINPNPQEPLRYPGGNTGSSDSGTVATPAPRSDAVTDLNSYYANCITQLSILGSGDQHFDNVVPKSLWSSIEQAYNTGAYEQGYVVDVLKNLGMEDKLEGRTELIAGINHMAWLLELHDKAGNDLYPVIREKARQKNKTEKHWDMVRYEYIEHLGYYCTESSEHNAEYNPLFIKSRYPEMIEEFNIPLDEYPRRCLKHDEIWDKEKLDILNKEEITHKRSKEYASYIMEAIVTNKPYKIGGNVINTGLIDNLPADACVEVPCLVDGSGITPCHVGRLPVQLAAMNMTNINPQLVTIEAARTRKKEHIYQAAMLDPHTAAELNIKDIHKMVDELIEAHGDYMKMYQ